MKLINLIIRFQIMCLLLLRYCGKTKGGNTRKIQKYIGYGNELREFQTSLFWYSSMFRFNVSMIHTMAQIFINKLDRQLNLDGKAFDPAEIDFPNEEKWASNWSFHLSILIIIWVYIYLISINTRSDIWAHLHHCGARQLFALPYKIASNILADCINEYDYFDMNFTFTFHYLNSIIWIWCVLYSDASHYKLWF